MTSPSVLDLGFCVAHTNTHLNYKETESKELTHLIPMSVMNEVS